MICHKIFFFCNSYALKCIFNAGKNSILFILSAGFYHFLPDYWGIQNALANKKCVHTREFLALISGNSYITAINAGFLTTIYLMLSGLCHFSRSLLSVLPWASILPLIPRGAEAGSARCALPAITNTCGKHRGDCRTCAGKYQASNFLTCLEIRVSSFRHSYTKWTFTPKLASLWSRHQTLPGQWGPCPW